MWATPYPKSLSKLVIDHTCSTHAHLLPKVVEAGYWGTLHPNHYPHAQLHINSHTPSSTSTPIPHTPYHLYTNYTPTIHNPTTHPIPLLLRVDSDEMWQKPVGFWLMRHWNARERPRSGRPRSGLRASYKQGLSGAQRLFVASAGAQTKVDEECFSESCRVCAVTVKVPTNLKIFPKTTQMVKKFPSNTTYHLMVTNFTEFHRISPDHPR